MSQTTLCPFGTGRQHRIDIIAKKADKVGTTGVASRRNEQLFATRAPTNIHNGAPSVVGSISTLYVLPFGNLPARDRTKLSFDNDFQILGGSMQQALQVLVRKLKEHSRLAAEDVATIYALNCSVKTLSAHEDLIRQGDDPSVSAVVLSGIVARYHLLASGARQYLSFHMAGDMPDSQALFIDKMDHAVCAIGNAVVASVQHKELLAAFNRRPEVCFAIWRETLVDAAIFREAITNNSARTMRGRLAHLFCELFYRAKASNLVEGDVFEMPISRAQLGETLGMSIATVNRTLEELRASKAVSFQRGQLHMRNWDALVRIARFNPAYLHQKKPPPLNI